MHLTARHGEIYAHLFENPRTGLARNLYWNIHVELEPVELLGENCNSSFLCDWLVWPVRTIDDLDGVGLAQIRYPELVEASLYLFSEHHPIKVDHLLIRRLVAKGYKLEVRGEIDVEIDGQSVRGRFDFQSGLNFDGIIIVPESLTPAPSTPSEIAGALNGFISLDGLEEPLFDRFRYVLRPITR